MKNIVSAAIVASILALAAGPVSADTRVYIGNGGERHVERNHRDVPHGRGDHRRDDTAAAIMGFLGGFAVGSALDNGKSVPVIRHRPDRYDPPRHYRPAPRYSSLSPWSPGWYRWCDARYRSFDPKSGTYRDYDGRRRFCQPGR